MRNTSHIKQVNATCPTITGPPVGRRAQVTLRIYFIITVSWAAALWVVPFSSFGVEIGIQCIAFLLMGGHVFCALGLGAGSARANVSPVRRRLLTQSIVATVCLMVSFWERLEAVKILSPAVCGMIKETYRSKNHGIGSIRLVGQEGQEFEGVYWPLWEKLEPGQVVEKEAYSPHAKVNGEPVVFVAPRWWWGPRGLLLPKVSQE